MDKGKGRGDVRLAKLSSGCLLGNRCSRRIARPLLI